MSITTCPECGGKVSTLAVSCPHCGYRLSQQNKMEQAEQHTEQPALQDVPVVEKEQKIDYFKEWGNAPEQFKKPIRTCEKGRKIIKIIETVYVWLLGLFIVGYILLAASGCSSLVPSLSDFWDNATTYFVSLYPCAIVIFFFETAKTAFKSAGGFCRELKLADWIAYNKYDRVDVLRQTKEANDKMLKSKDFSLDMLTLPYEFSTAVYLLENPAMRQSYNKKGVWGVILDALCGFLAVLSVSLGCLISLINRELLTSWPATGDMFVKIILPFVIGAVLAFIFNFVCLRLYGKYVMARPIETWKETFLQNTQEAKEVKETNNNQTN